MITALAALPVSDGEMFSDCRVTNRKDAQESPSFSARHSLTLKDAYYCIYVVEVKKHFSGSLIGTDLISLCKDKVNIEFRTVRSSSTSTYCAVL